MPAARATRVVVALLALPFAACVAVEEGEAPAPTECPSLVEACTAAGQACGSLYEPCRDETLPCEDEPSLCEAELPGAVCGIEGRCCVPGCPPDACGGVDPCFGTPCRDGCEPLVRLREATPPVTAWPVDAPAGRAGAAFAVDEETGEGLLFGGTGDVEGVEVRYGDAWRISPDGQRFTQVEVPAALTPRDGASMVWDPLLRRFLLFGGVAEGDRYLDELWSFDGTTFTPEPQPGDRPPASARAAFAVDPVRREALLFGGEYARGEPGGEAWLLDLAASPVHWRRSWNDVPRARSGATLTWDGRGLADESGGLVLHGGYAGGPPGDPPLGETQRWDGTSWRVVTLEGEGLRTRQQHCAAARADGTILLFGGWVPTVQWRSAPLLIDARAGTVRALDEVVDGRYGCIGGRLGGVPTVGFGRQAVRSFDDLWRLPER